MENNVLSQLFDYASIEDIKKLNVVNHSKIIYIALPITGDEENAEKRANMLTSKFIALGFNVINPFDVDHNHDKKHHSYMRADLQAMLNHDVEFVYFDDKWEFSIGCRIENFIASNLNYKKFYHDTKIENILSLVVKKESKKLMFA